MSDKAVSVTFDASTLQTTFDPSDEEIPWGENDSIIWTLETINNSGSKPDATFAATNGIYFKSDNNPPWPGGNPYPLSSTQWKVEDDNTGTNSAGTFRYGANIVYDGETYNVDPQVTNDPKGG